MCWQDRVTAFLANPNWQNNPDWLRTNGLRNDIQNYRTEFPNNGLSLNLFNEIITWKLREQIHRVQQYLENLNEQMIVEVTRTAFVLNHEDPDTLTTVRAKILMSLPGVGIGVASAILTLYYPLQYGIIDFRSWDEIQNHPPNLPTITRNFSIGKYLYYLGSIREYAIVHHFDVQTIDYALWKIWELRRL